MERSTAPADPAGAYERVTRKRARRRAVRRVQMVGLTVAVVIVTSGVTFTLGRMFGSERREANETPTPAARSFLAFAFASDRGGDLDIYVADSDGAGVQRVTDDPDDEFGPAWSPDGTRIAFTRGLEDDPNIYIVNSDGSGEVQLTDDPADDADPAWSPDGTSIAFVSTREGDSDVYLMSADGSDQRRLTDHSASDFDPAWSADGTQLFFSRDEHDGAEQSDIWLMSIRGRKAWKVVGGPDSQYQPAPSPDGTRLAFVSNRDGVAQIYVMDLPDSEPRQLTHTPANKSRPSWSPDGKQIVFAAGDETNREVFAINVDGTGIRPVTTNPADDVTPEWNPVAEGEPASPVLPSCGPDQFSLLVEGDGAGGGLVPSVEVEHRGEEPCHFSEVVTLRIEDPDGNLLDIEGNPATVTLQGDLPRQHFAAAWWFRNWCGEAVDFVYRADADGRISEFRESDSSPRCDAPEGPSTLVELP